MASGTALRPQSHVAPLLTSFLFIASSSEALTSQFRHFYPQHGPKYEYIPHHNYSQQFANYLAGRPQNFPIDWLGGGSRFSVLVEPVVNCLLNNVSEYIKATSSTVQVILGVTPPPLLATLGASTDELALLNVVGRRPLLALLISFGNPSVYMERVFDFRQSEKMLQRSRGRYRPYVPDTALKRWLVVGLQYAIAFAAASNIATLSWQLGIWAVCRWWPETVFGPLVWTILSVPIHLAGTFAIRLCVRGIYTDQEKISEWAPAGAQDEIRTVSFEEGKIYVAWSWLLSTATVIHILFGSLVLSGLLFIEPRNALLVIFRYVVSVLVCRILITFELAGMRARYVPEPDRKGSFEVVKLDDKSVKDTQSTQKSELHSVQEA